MRKPETTFIQSIHRHLPVDLYRVKMNNPYNAGIADVWYSAARDLWVEYKFLTLPKRDNTLIDLTAGKDPMLSALQQDWLNGRYAEGRNVWVIVGCKEGGVIHTNRAWEQPHSTAQYRGSLLSRVELAAALQRFLESP